MSWIQVQLFVLSRKVDIIPKKRYENISLQQIFTSISFYAILRAQKGGNYMVNIDIDFNNKIGKIKPMHAVNNGPVYKFASDQRITNLDSYRQAGIPYARTHDASFYEDYGGEHIVDVHAIFPNFENDPCDPDSYR